MGDNIMIAGSDPRVSSRIWLCVVVAALGLIAVSMHFPLRVHAQTAQAQTLRHKRLTQDMLGRSSRRIRLPRLARLIPSPRSTWT